MGFNLTTFVFELVNFVVLLVLLERFVYRPLRRGVAARREALAAREAEAKRLSDEAAQLKSELEARARAIDELRAAALRDASAAAADERARILEQAREDAAADRARAQHLIEAEHAASEAAVGELAIRQATALAAKLLGHLSPRALEEALLDALLTEVEQHGAAWKREPDFPAEEGLEVTWAGQPHGPAQRRLEDTIGRVLGPGLALTHREDPSLGAGMVLRLGHRVLDASTAGHLEVVRGRARALLEGGAGRE
jgi:F-type H+-transporting ATPase subunit b